MSRVAVDSSKLLKTLDEMREVCKDLAKMHEELQGDFETAYKNDNLLFYSKMGKMTGKFKEGFDEVSKTFENLTEQAMEHSNRMAKLSEEY